MKGAAVPEEECPLPCFGGQTRLHRPLAIVSPSRTWFGSQAGGMQGFVCCYMGRFPWRCLMFKDVRQGVFLELLWNGIERV